jgi:hypothetical protein
VEICPDFGFDDTPSSGTDLTVFALALYNQAINNSQCCRRVEWLFITRERLADAFDW